MIGKLIVQARSRELAIRKMKMALSELTIDGIDINRDLLAEICRTSSLSAENILLTLCLILKKA